MENDEFFFRAGEDSPFVVALQLDVLDTGLNLNVSARDEMFNVFYYSRGESRDAALHMYLESGKRIWSTLKRALEWHFGDLSKLESVLDFASGYGRVSRFIVNDIPADRVWISEIDRQAVRFQEEIFGVHGLLTTSLPEEFVPERQFDCVLVSSLFTHLPERRFLGWLQELLGVVKESGLLAFSVHDTSLCADAGEAPLVFRESSESGSLSTAEYGSTWVTESYVRSSLASLAPECGLQVWRIPRGLANYQDLFVVTRGEGKPTAKAFPHECRGGVDGFVEHCQLSAAPGLALQGWLLDRLTKEPVREVRAYVSGQLVARSDQLADRREVEQAFPGDAGVGQGWRLDIPLPRRHFLKAPLRVVAVGADGFPSAFLETTVEAILTQTALWSRLGFEGAQAELREQIRRTEELAAAEAARAREREARAHERIAALEVERDGESARALGLEDRIAAMRASRFWKLRNRWFAWKRRLRLTTEE
jgi:SAM-dependent methyltransferase